MSEIKTRKPRDESRHNRIKELVLIMRDPNSSETQKDNALATILEENEKWLYATVTKNFTYPPSLLEDLVQCAKIGVIESLKTFDPERGTLGTYSYNYIIHEVTAELARNAGISPHTQGNIAKYNRARNIARANGNKNPTARDIAMYGQMPLSAAVTAETARNGVAAISLDAPPDIIGEDTREMIDMLPSPIGNPEEEFAEKESRTVIFEALRTLDKDEARACILSFGLDNHDKRSNIQVGKIMHIEPSKVKDLLNSARRKLAKNGPLRKFFSRAKPETEFEEIPVVSTSYVERELMVLEA